MSSSKDIVVSQLSSKSSSSMVGLGSLTMFDVDVDGPFDVGVGVDGPFGQGSLSPLAMIDMIESPLSTFPRGSSPENLTRRVSCRRSAHEAAVDSLPATDDGMMADAR
jgi:hypothetical protein